MTLGLTTEGGPLPYPFVGSLECECRKKAGVDFNAGCFLMLRSLVSSTSLASIGYDPDSGVLEVEFRSGEVYQYQGVPADVAEEFTEAPSKGTYLYVSKRPDQALLRVRETRVNSRVSTPDWWIGNAQPLGCA